MAVIYGKHYEPLTKRQESYVEFDELVVGGDSYVIRMTALWPYKNSNGADPDELRAHIDFLNATQGVSGRFEDIRIPGRDPNAPQGHLRRWTTIAKFQELLATATPVPSPVWP